MRICFIGDPASIHTQRWVRWFAREHEATVIGTTADDALADLTVATLPASGTLPGQRLARAVRLVRRTVDEIAPDILHAHYINEGGWFGAASGRHPFVLSAWGSDLYRAHESLLTRRLNPWAAKRADALTCDSKDQARVLSSWGVAEGRIEVINWGVDRDEFHPGVDGGGFRAAHDIPATSPVILSPRQWLPNSNIETIVTAHARMAEEAVLVLKRMPRFERDGGRSVASAVAQSPRADLIRVVDEIAAHELASMYAAADIVVSLCTTDGTPVSILEAMALGKPIVALRNASVAEWVSEPGGRIVDTLDPAPLAAELDALVRGRGSVEAGAHNVAVVAERADRTSEMVRVAAMYERLAARGTRDGG